MLKRRGISVLSLAVLLLCVMSLQPQKGLSNDRATNQVKLSVKSGDNNSALWVRNLSARSANLAVGINSPSAQELASLSESLAGNTTVRLAESLSASLRGNDLLFRSNERIAVIAASAGLPIDRSEFYYSGLPELDRAGATAPKWVIELNAIGKSGKNVLRASTSGHAPVVKGQSEHNKRYAFGVGVALKKKKSAVEINLISSAGQVIKSITLSGSKALFWQGELGEFISGTDEFPHRLEIHVLDGKVQGFLSMRDVETGERLSLPVVPKREQSASESGKFSIQSNNCWPYGGGYAYFSNGVYDCPNDSYYYEVYCGPPNTCGTLNIVRNGNSESTPGWICTDAYGYARKPSSTTTWTVSTDQTGTSIYIDWGGGLTTEGADYKVDDDSAPGIDITTCNSTVISGPASDTQWGSGFNFGFGGWSRCFATFQQSYWPFKYWDGTGYNSYTPVEFDCSVSPSGGGYSINWSIVPPPSAGSTLVTVTINDICQSVYDQCSY